MAKNYSLQMELGLFESALIALYLAKVGFPPGGSSAISALLLRCPIVATYCNGYSNLSAPLGVASRQPAIDLRSTPSFRCSLAARGLLLICTSSWVPYRGFLPPLCTRCEVAAPSQSLHFWFLCPNPNALCLCRMRCA